MNNEPLVIMIEKPDSTQDNKKSLSPWRCFVGVLLSGSLATACYSMTRAIANTYANKPIISDNQVTVNIASAVRTLVVGIASLGTFVFAFATLGLFALGIQLTIQSFKQRANSSTNRPVVK
jgi:hypothetical protein